MSPGSVSAGGVVSTTVIVKLPDATFQFSSPVKQDIVVVPIGNVSPESPPQHTSQGDESTRSAALTEKLTIAPDGPVASLVMFPGRLRAGGVVSCTRTRKLPETVLPPLSVAEQLT